jgi:hypothetical protein
MHQTRAAARRWSSDRIEMQAAEVRFECTRSFVHHSIFMQDTHEQVADVP